MLFLNFYYQNIFRKAAYSLEENVFKNITNKCAYVRRSNVAPVTVNFIRYE